MSLMGTKPHARDLVYFVSATRDGYVAGPEGADPSGEEFLAPPPDLLELLVRDYPETLPEPARQAIGLRGSGVNFDTVLEGRASYEVGLAAGITDAYPHLRHIVFSRTLDGSPAPDVEVVSANPVQTVNDLKSAAGMDIWLVGGGGLAYSLLPVRQDVTGDAYERAESRIARRSAPYQGAAERLHPGDRNVDEVEVPHVRARRRDGRKDELTAGDPDR